MAITKSIDILSSGQGRSLESCLQRISSETMIESKLPFWRYSSFELPSYRANSTIWLPTRTTGPTIPSIHTDMCFTFHNRHAKWPFWSVGVPIDPFGQRVSLVTNRWPCWRAMSDCSIFRVFKWIRQHLTGMAFGFAYALPSFLASRIRAFSCSQRL